jgi:hypothetical protein
MKDYPFIDFEIDGMTFHYTGTPILDDFQNAKWWSPKVRSELTKFDDETRDEATGLSEVFTASADVVLRTIIERSGGRIMKVHSIRPDGFIRWDDFKDFYVH